MAAPFERYLRHGQRYGADDEFWKAASSAGLAVRELRRLAAELGTKLPKRWSAPQNGGPDPASQAGLTANKSAIRPVGPGDVLAPVEARFGRRCSSCDGGLGAMNTSGLCRRCYQRELMRRRRAVEE